MAPGRKHTPGGDSLADQTKGDPTPKAGRPRNGKERKNKMEQYDYLNAVINDVKAAIKDLGEDEKKELAKLDEDEKEEYLHDLFWDNDRVTGNASGSYTFNAWKAEENLCHNGELIIYMAKCYGYSFDDLADLGPEKIDVSLRCYVLPEAIIRVLEEEE